MSATETEEFVDAVQTDTGDVIEPESLSSVEMAPEYHSETVVDDSGGADVVEGGRDDSPPEPVSDDLRKRGRDMFSDDELRALGTPEAVDSARRALLASMVRHGHTTPQDAEKAEQVAPPANETKAAPSTDSKPFEINLNREMFDEDQANEIERAIRGVVEHFSKQSEPVAGKVNEITQMIEAQRSASVRAYESEIVNSMSRIQKSLGDKYSEVFGGLPMSEIIKNPESAEFKRVKRLVGAMEQADMRTRMGGPSTWDADFAVDMLFGSRDPELVQIARRAERKSINDAVSKASRGGTRAPTSRREEPKKSMKELREEAIQEAKELRAKSRQ